MRLNPPSMLIFLISLVLALRGEPACIWPGIQIALLLLLPVLAALGGGGDGGQFYRECSFWLMVAGIVVLGCQGALNFAAVRHALGLGEEWDPPQREHQRKPASRRPSSDAIQDGPDDG